MELRRRAASGRQWAVRSGKSLMLDVYWKPSNQSSAMTTEVLLMAIWHDPPTSHCNRLPSLPVTQSAVPPLPGGLVPWISWGARAGKCTVDPSKMEKSNTKKREKTVIAPVYPSRKAEIYPSASSSARCSLSSSQLTR